MVNVIMKGIIMLIKPFVIGFILFIMITVPASNYRHQDSRAKPFVNEFIRLGKLFKIKNIEQDTLNIKIKFDTIKTNKELANCNYYYDEITINTKYWDKLPIENKEEVIFHELGHCVLKKRDHTEVGIMKAVGLHDPEIYRTHYHYLINYLFDEFQYVDVEWDRNKYESPKEIKVTKTELLNNTHAVVRFTATWCPPCKALAPVFDEVAKNSPDVVVYVIDVDQNPELATEMNVRGIPCMIQIKNNAVTSTLVGNQPKPEIEKLFK